MTTKEGAIEKVHEAKTLLLEATQRLEQAEKELKDLPVVSVMAQYILDKLWFYNPTFTEQRDLGDGSNLIQIEMDGDYTLFQCQNDLKSIVKHGYFIGAVESNTNSTRLGIKFFSI